MDRGFYEPDEPMEKVAAAFERGDKGVTRQPKRGFNEALNLPGALSVGASTQTVGQCRYISRYEIGPFGGPAKEWP